MAGNDSIQILRGTSESIDASDETLLDGQLLYDKTNNKLYIGNGEQPVNSATQIGGMEGLSIYRSNQSARTTSSTYIYTNSIEVPDDRELQVGDLIIANSTYSYLYRVTNTANTAAVNVTYLQSLRGASGSSGGSGSDGPGIYVSTVAATDATKTINRNTVTNPSGFLSGVGDIILANSRLFYINTSSGSTSTGTFGVNLVANLIGDRGATGSSAQIDTFNRMKWFVTFNGTLVSPPNGILSSLVITTKYNSSHASPTMSNLIYMWRNSLIGDVTYENSKATSGGSPVTINASSINVPATGFFWSSTTSNTSIIYAANISASEDRIYFHGYNASSDTTYNILNGSSQAPTVAIAVTFEM